jgi:proline iminopeptidase
VTDALRTGWNEVELNGSRQWVSLRGDPAAPSLLFLHGGPGGAEYGPRRHYLGGLEKAWRVVDWEQRGAGRSFRGDESPATLSLERLVDDGLALVARLRAETHGRPLLLVGHSFGTVLGTRMASVAPGHLVGYVGAAQVVDWSLQEERSYGWALAEARRLLKSKAVAALESIGPPSMGCYAGGTASVEVQRRWLGALGGVSGDPRFLTRWMLSILTRPDYPMRTKLRFRRAMQRSMDLVWRELGERVHFGADVTELAVPVHLFAGDRDRITDLDQVQTWFEGLQAPQKRLEVVPGTGHLNLYEAPARFLAFLDRIRDEVA